MPEWAIAHQSTPPNLIHTLIVIMSVRYSARPVNPDSRPNYRQASVSITENTNYDMICIDMDKSSMVLLAQLWANNQKMPN